MDCAAVKPRMEALVRGTLPEPERALAEQHISTCEGCRLELELVRAIGSQEKPPAVGRDDWTLDRIFGGEGQQGGAPTPAPATPVTAAPATPMTAAPAAPANSGFETAFEMPKEADTRASTFDKAPAGMGAASPEEGKKEEVAEEVAEEEKKPEKEPDRPASWDFEPADAKADVKPPEESLFFATEALTRRRDPEVRKPSNFRVLLWGVGGIVGAMLLAFSSWFVLHMSPNPEDSAPGIETPSKNPGGGGAATQEAPEEDLDPDAIEHPNDGETPGPDSEVPDVTAQSAPPPAPRVSASSIAPPPPIAGGTRPAPGSAPVTHSPPAASVTPAPQAPSVSSPGMTRAIPPSTHPAPPEGSAATPAPAGSNARGVTPAPRPAADKEPPSESAGRPATSVPVKPSPRAWVPPPDDVQPTDEEPAPPATREKPRSQSWLDAHAGSAPTSPKGGPPPGTAAPGEPETAAPPSGSKPSAEKPPAPEITSPIDRLRLATVTAEEASDLAALRRLRSSWKAFMSKMGVGPERARAKRDYADCLWAIQSLTGSRADQKNALAAYREYLLGAPAGGADSRSVSRLRQLEDALAERR